MSNTKIQSQSQQQQHKRHIIIICLLALFLLQTFCSNVLSAHAAAATDECGHTFVRPAGFFNSGLLKKIFKHLNPFSSKERIKMQFFLYKRNFTDCGREILLDDEESLEMSAFNASHQTRFIIHGWMSQSRNSYIRAIKNAYLTLAAASHASNNETEINNDVDMDENDDTFAAVDNQATNYTNEDFNVIVVDWSVISTNVNYFSVVDSIDDLGQKLAEFLLFLHTRAFLQFNDVYLIGHSLGAQISGNAGKHIKPHRLNTIFALDPAGPKFRNASLSERLDATDANYVESIQTSSTFGFEEPVGHATFYPNFGRSQKKCYKYGCSHSRSHDYFAESLTSRKGFWGTLCKRQSDDVWIFSDAGTEFRMGGEPSAPKQGTFYVKTNGRRPYALGRRNKVTNS